MWPSEIEEKKAFAIAWLKQSDPFKAAVDVFGPTNAGKCLKVADEWPRDPFVLQCQKDLIEEQGEEAFLPTKAAAARKVLDIADGFAHADYKLKALRLYAEIMGYIVKPEAGDGPKNGGVVAVPMTPTETKL